MKELDLFRKFISEEKEIKVSEDKIEKAIKDTLEKEGGAAGIDPLKKAVKDLDVDKDFDIEKFLKKMSNVEKHKNGDYILTPLKENDSVEEGLFDDFKKELGDVLNKAKEMAKEMEKGATSGGDGSSRATKDRQLKADAKKAGVDFKEGQTNEIFGEKGNQRIKISNDMKIGKALSALEDALFELNFLGVISDNDYNNFWMDKYGELYMDTMGELDPSVQKMYDYEGVEDMELEENDAVLDEIVKEAKFKVGDMVYRKSDDARFPMKVVGVRKMFASPLHAITVVGTSGGDKLEYDETQLVKL